MAADTGMDTCPSPDPEISDSRKRPLDGDSENGDIKRSHFSSVQDLVTALPMANGHANPSHFAVEPTYHFKVLVPSMVAGAIIGKGGETIAQLQKDTGARVKMSKSHDFYPGTTERACLITGSVEGIMVVLDFIMEKIKEKPELVKPFPEGVDAKMPQDRDKQVKILVPNSTAGMIIGKGGNYIKQIKEQSGSYVQISQKAKELSLQERCITVVGEKENNKKACLMILQKVVDDPQSGSCPNVSYADVAGPVANYNPTGSPYAVATESHALGAGRARERVGSGRAGAVVVAGAARHAPIAAADAAHARSHQGGAAAGGALGGRSQRDRRGAGAAGQARRAGAGAAHGAARRAPPSRLLPPPHPGLTGLRPARPGAAGRGAHLAVGWRGRRGRRALPLRRRRTAAPVQEPHARRRRRQGLQERRDPRGHRGSHPRSRRAQPGGDPADVGREHPDLEEGHFRAGHAQSHRHHQRHRHRHRQRALPHRAEDPGGGAEAHAPHSAVRPAAVAGQQPASSQPAASS